VAYVNCGNRSDLRFILRKRGCKKPVATADLKKTTTLVRCVQCGIARYRVLEEDFIKRCSLTSVAVRMQPIIEKQGVNGRPKYIRCSLSIDMHERVSLNDYFVSAIAIGGVAPAELECGRI